MQQLDISLIRMESNTSMESIAVFMNRFKKHRLNFAPWLAFPYKPEVFFRIGYGKSGIFLKYTVLEKSIRAATHTANGPVWEDSCVEFFIAFDGSGYYNLEFNCIGTCLAEFGKSREDRALVPEDLVQGVRSHCVIDRHKEEIFWELTLDIPFTIFAFHEIRSLEGKKAKGNFFKCGDQLPDPHFLCWNEIEAEHPDFHLPQFFGHLSFEPANVIH